MIVMAKPLWVQKANSINEMVSFPMRTKPGLLHNKRGPMQLSCSQVAVSPVREWSHFRGLCWLPLSWQGGLSGGDSSSFGKGTSMLDPLYPATSAGMTTLPMEQAQGHLEKGQTFLRRAVLSICSFGTLSAGAHGEYILGHSVFTLCTHSQRSPSPQTLSPVF